MPIKSHQLQAEFARRREVEHEQIERTQNVHRYYSHWGNVNSRFEQWTAPEYYKQAEEQLKQRKEKKEKQEKLAERREKLRIMLDAEHIAEQQEQREKEGSKARHTSTEMLQKVEARAKDRENIKRKLEMEAKLYGQWRHGVDDPNLIFESKSDNETLAKLNWIDKQIEEQMQREKEEAIAQERNLRLQQEISKTVQTQKERQQIREHEIEEIRALQESHMDALNQRKTEAETLKKEEACLREFIKELEKERELLEASAAVTLDSTEMSQAYNLTRIKVFIRQRSDECRKQIKMSMDMLKRLNEYAAQSGLVKKLLDKYKAQEEAEARTLQQIESMYESEAKYNLQRCEDIWKSQHQERCQELKQLLDEEFDLYGAQLQENRQRQMEILDMRSAHLSAIENSNEKLKQLFSERQDSTACSSILVPAPIMPETKGAGAVAPRSIDRPLSSRRFIPQVTNSFSNLNFDGWQDPKQITPRRGRAAVDNFLTPLPNISQQRELGTPTMKSSNLYSPRETRNILTPGTSHSARELGGTATSSIVPSPRFSHESFRAATPKPTDDYAQQRLASLSKRTNSFDNLNLHRSSGLPAKGDGGDDPDVLLSQRSAQSQGSAQSQTSERPKFARKRVAWT